MAERAYSDDLLRGDTRATGTKYKDVLMITLVIVTYSILLAIISYYIIFPLFGEIIASIILSVISAIVVPIFWISVRRYRKELAEGYIVDCDEWDCQTYIV